MFKYEKPLPAFNGVKFTDLFSGWSLCDTNPKIKVAEIQRNNLSNENKASFIQKWLRFSRVGRDSLNVEPTQELINWIDNNMLAIDYDRIYFEIVIPENSKRFDLYARYNQIIGSRLLASFPLSQLPKLKAYWLIGSSRQVGAIGIMEDFSEDILASDPKTAYKAGTQAQYNKNRDHVLVKQMNVTVKNHPVLVHHSEYLY